MTDLAVAQQVKAAPLVWRLAALAAVAATFLIQARFILVHFSHGGYFIDGGWFAYLFGGGDPWLRAPRALGDGSYYQHHLSPYLYLLGALLKPLGLSGISIFALHQGAAFALFLLALLMIAYEAEDVATRAVAAASALGIGALSNLLFQAAEYPHFEILLLALAAFAVAAWRRGLYAGFALALIALPFVREDGGFYAALAAALIAAIEMPGLTRRRIVALAAVILAGAVFSFAAILVQRLAFPASTTLGNFSGDHWRHLTLAELGRRAAAVMGNPSLALTLVGTAWLTTFDRRYAAGLVLTGPLLAVDFVAAKDFIASFSLYYALPWLFVALVWLAVFVSRRAGTQRKEALVLIAVSLLITAPAQALLGVKSAFWRIPVQAVTEDIGDIDGMRGFFAARIAAFRAKGEGALCATMGAVSLAPDALTPEETERAKSGMGGCGELLTMSGQTDSALIGRLAAASGLRREASDGYAEAWTREP